LGDGIERRLIGVGKAAGSVKTIGQTIEGLLLAISLSQ
jgi:hypothetical protein